MPRIKYDEEYMNDGTVVVNVKCPVCGKISKVTMTEDQFDEWTSDSKRVQDIFPSMKKEIREILISGNCPKCWDEMFGKHPWEEE